MATFILLSGSKLVYFARRQSTWRDIKQHHSTPQVKITLIDEIKSRRGGQSSNKAFSAMSQTVLSYCRAAAMAYLDLACVFCHFSHATRLDKLWRLLFWFSSTVVEHILVDPAIRGPPSLSMPTTSIKQWLFI